MLVSLWLSACASPPPLPNEGLFADRLFSAPSVKVDPASALAVDDDMRQFLRERFAAKYPPVDLRHWFVDALYSRGELQLEYDTAGTRNASEAFHARAGNCLSLVLMTAAMAKEMGLRVRYQSVAIDETWGRQGSLYLSFAHVNLTLSERTTYYEGKVLGVDPLTIDFLPPKDLPRLRTREIGEDTVIAMYLNNRAVEALAAGRMDDAYAWARAAIGRAADFDMAYNTLAVIYRNQRQPVLAERALQRVLERRPDDVRALSNLALALRDQGRAAEADAVSRRLRAIQPEPPFAYFDRGVAAMEAGEYKLARGLFLREIERAPHEHEFHFWLARAELSLGNVDGARRQLTQARDASSTPGDRRLYAAKLERLREGAAH